MEIHQQGFFFSMNLERLVNSVKTIDQEIMLIAACPTLREKEHMRRQ